MNYVFQRALPLAGRAPALLNFSSLIQPSNYVTRFPNYSGRRVALWSYCMFSCINVKDKIWRAFSKPQHLSLKHSQRTRCPLFVENLPKKNRVLTFTCILHHPCMPVSYHVILVWSPPMSATACQQKSFANEVYSLQWRHYIIQSIAIWYTHWSLAIYNNSKHDEVGKTWARANTKHQVQYSANELEWRTLIH